VGSDLVAFGVHALDDFDKLVSCVDLTFVDVVACDEEGALGVVFLENIQYVTCELLLWPVIVRKSDSSIFDASEDARSTVWYLPGFVTNKVRCVLAFLGCVILRAGRTVLVVASRGVAIGILGTADLKSLELCVLRRMRRYRTSSYRTTFPGRTRANALTTLLVTRPYIQRMLPMRMMAPSPYYMSSQIPQVIRTKSHDIREAKSMSIDKRCKSCCRRSQCRISHIQMLQGSAARFQK
jgi:hypothetical protein